MLWVVTWCQAFRRTHTHACKGYRHAHHACKGYGLLAWKLFPLLHEAIASKCHSKTSFLVKKEAKHLSPFYGGGHSMGVHQGPQDGCPMFSFHHVPLSPSTVPTKPTSPLISESGARVQSPRWCQLSAKGTASAPTAPVPRTPSPAVAGENSATTPHSVGPVVELGARPPPSAPGPQTLTSTTPPPTLWSRRRKFVRTPSSTRGRMWMTWQR